MITLIQLVDFCMKKPAVTQEFPFDKKTMVFKVLGKMFLLTNISEWNYYKQKINIKNNPDKNKILRDRHESIVPGYHMNKKHWNTIHIFEEELDDENIFHLIDESYEIVKSKLSKKDQKSFF